MKQIVCILCLLISALTISCSGEDRSSEQPLRPTLRTLSAIVDGDSCKMKGLITSSPNSRVIGRGFVYGKSGEKEVKIESADTTLTFSGATPILGPGSYFGVAFATNGMGTSYGDTLHFVIEGEGE